MDNPGEITEILRLCRLCLVKDQVNIPIFDEQGDIRQIFLKISSCLPVKVSREDQLPKKICDGCSNKLDLLYEFWNTSANAEKTLLSWLGQAGVKDADETISAVAQQIAKPVEIPEVKEETEPLEDGQVPSHATDSFPVPSSFDEGNTDEAEAPPPKRARRTAAVKAQINLAPESDDDEDDDMDNAEPMTKMEDESDESEGEEKDPSYSEVPGTSADDQAGPSGVGKDGVEAPVRSQNEFAQHIKDKIGTNGGLLDIDFVNIKEEFNESDEEEFSGSDEEESSENDEEDFSENDDRFHVNVDELEPENISNTNSEASLVCEEPGNPSYTVNKAPIVCEELENISDTVRKAPVVCEDPGITGNTANEAPVVCDICGRKFVKQRYLDMHRNSHTKVSSYRCQFCDKILLSSSQLKEHLATHTGKCNFKCDICSKTFKSKFAIKAHKITHTREKAYKCNICNKVYRYVGSLNNHKKGHAKEVKLES